MTRGRDLNFKILLKPKIGKQLDFSDKFWAKFNAEKTSLKKQVCIYETEAVENQIRISIPVNFKECFVKQKNKDAYKKHKDARKGLTKMLFESYARKNIVTKRSQNK